MLTNLNKTISSLASHCGMLAVLVLLCVFFSWATFRTEAPTGQGAALAVADSISARVAKGMEIAVVAPADQESTEFAVALKESLTKAGYTVRVIENATPPDVRAALELSATSHKPISAIATTRVVRDWAMWDKLATTPALANVQMFAPETMRRSTFLSASNLRNIADQIAVIAIMAVGMTLVIMTGGIDLSVGSLLALSAVSTAWLIQKAGGENASTGTIIGASVAGVALCGATGAFSGWLIARYRVPPFIVTLAGMQIASGFAFIVAQGQSIYAIPASFTWLGRGTTLFTLPNAVILMALVYVGAHLFMSQTCYGRYIYAVGGNMESARLTGVPVSRTLILVYILSALTAGIGGVITASQLKAGAPTYGTMYEMYVIAAVVVGGTSLTGGQGRVLGTLIGAFVIAVIRNGMNLMDVEPYTQKVLLGVVILGAVLADMARRRRQGTGNR